MVPHLIVFSEKEMHGRHWQIFNSIPSIGSVSFTWDDNISSLVVLAGQWQFYRGRHYQDPVGAVLGPGIYPSLAELGIPNDSVSSIQFMG